MPNWCENFMRLEVPNAQEADIIEAVLNENKQVYEDFKKTYLKEEDCLSGVSNL